MKNYNKLISILYILSRFCFRLILIFIIIVVVAEFFTSDGKIGNGQIGIHHSKGYPFPVNVSPKKNSIDYSEIEINKKIPLTFKKLTHKGHQISANRGIANHYKIIDYIPADVMKFEKIDFGHFPYIQTNIYIKTNSLLINSFLGFRIYLLLFYFLLISFYSAKILKILKNDLIFQPEISKYLNIIGIIMLMELFKIITYQLFDKKLIELLKLRNEMIFGDFSLNNIFNLSLMPFIIGLLFLLLALIFKRAYYLQKENDLTI